MKLVVMLLALFIAAFHATSTFAENNGKENSSNQIAYLAIDGNEYELMLNQESQLNIDDKQYTVMIRLASQRVFDNAGIEFKYPSSLHYNLDNSQPEVTIWNISGGDSLILILEFKSAVSKRTIIDSLKSEFVGMRAYVDLKDIKLEGKKEVLEGTQLNAKFDNFTLTQEVYLLRNESRTVAIVLQDASVDGVNKPEYQNMRNIIKESLIVKKGFKNISS